MIADKLSQQMFKELLEEVYVKGYESELKTTEVIQEIRTRIQYLLDQNEKLDF